MGAFLLQLKEKESPIPPITFHPKPGGGSPSLISKLLQSAVSDTVHAMSIQHC